MPHGHRQGENVRDFYGDVSCPLFRNQPSKSPSLEAAVTLVHVLRFFQMCAYINIAASGNILAN